jgi:hypothetical protein
MKRSTRVRRRHTSAQRDEILAAYQQSRLSQKDFAAQAGIGHSTLRLWLRKAAANPGCAKSAFVPVANLFSASPAPPAYRLQFPQGITVEVTPGFQSQELGALLQLVHKL